MFINGKDKVGEAKVYLSQRELELERELEKYKKAYEKANKGLTSIVTCGDLITEGYAINVLKDCEAILKGESE